MHPCTPPSTTPEMVQHPSGSHPARQPPPWAAARQALWPFDVPSACSFGEGSGCGAESAQKRWGLTGSHTRVNVKWPPRRAGREGAVSKGTPKRESRRETTAPRVNQRWLYLWAACAPCFGRGAYRC